MKKYLVPLSIAALLLAGCSSEPAASDTAEQEPTRSSSAEPTADTEPTEETTEEVSEQGSMVTIMGPGAYTFETGAGGLGTLDAPGTAPAGIEELRTAFGAEPPTYISGTLDNTNGADSFDVYTITIYDTSGNELIYQPADDYLSEIKPAELETTLYNQYVDVSNSLSTVIGAAETTGFVLVGPPVPDEITGIMINDGYEDHPATPAE